MTTPPCITTCADEIINAITRAEMQYLKHNPDRAIDAIDEAKQCLEVMQRLIYRSERASGKVTA